MSVVGQCQVAKDAPNFCSGWVSLMVFTLIFPLKVLAHRLDKGLVIGEYFGTGYFLKLLDNAKWPKMLETFALDEVSMMVFTLIFYSKYQLINLTRDLS